MFYLPLSARAYHFPKFVRIHNFCSGPISVDPICPQPRSVLAYRMVHKSMQRVVTTGVTHQVVCCTRICWSLLRFSVSISISISISLSLYTYIYIYIYHIHSIYIYICRSLLRFSVLSQGGLFACCHVMSSPALIQARNNTTTTTNENNDNDNKGLYYYY